MFYFGSVAQSFSMSERIDFDSVNEEEMAEIGEIAQAIELAGGDASAVSARRLQEQVHSSGAGATPCPSTTKQGARNSNKNMRRKKKKKHAF